MPPGNVGNVDDGYVGGSNIVVNGGGVDVGGIDDCGVDDGSVDDDDDGDDGENPVLGRSAPPIHAAESRLLRAHRSALAQLRSGFSSFLNSYLVSRLS